VAARLAEIVDGAASLDVATYVSDTLDQVKYDKTNNSFTGGAELRALTHISLDGDTLICVPKEAGKVDEALWAIHSNLVEKAQANRSAMLKAVAEVITGLLPKGG
jgi:hypothetical protein